MRTRILYRAFFIALAAFASVVASATNFYVVSFEVSRSGQTIAAPSLMMLESEPVSFKTSGENRVELSAVIRSVSAGEMQLIVFLKTESGELSPAFMFTPNAPLTVSSGDLELRVKVDRNKT